MSRNKDTVAEGLAVLIADDLKRAIANLGYPVGMGLTINDEQAMHAGREIVFRIKDKALALLVEREKGR